MSKDEYTYQVNMTTDELNVGLYSAACLASIAGEHYGGGITGAEQAIKEAQNRAEHIVGAIKRGERINGAELITVLAIARGLYDNNPLEVA